LYYAVDGKWNDTTIPFPADAELLFPAISGSNCDLKCSFNGGGGKKFSFKPTPEDWKREKFNSCSPFSSIAKGDIAALAAAKLGNFAEDSELLFVDNKF
jgi:hypothetical protein